MPQERATRARLPLRTFVVLLALALLLGAATPASAVTRKQAARKALAALGSSTGTGPVIVFGLTKPLRAGTHVTQGRAKRIVLRVGHERAFFFYEDSGPFRAYPHKGRVALVGARSGKVRLSKPIAWAPRVNGKRPVFLWSSKRYRSSEYRVFYRSSNGDGGQNDGQGNNGQNNNDQNGDNPGHGNNPPQAYSQDEVIVKRNRSKNIVLTASDADGDMLTFAITKQPAHGTLTGAPPYVSYTPNPNFTGDDQFSFRAYDDLSHSNTAKVSLEVVPLGHAPAMTTSPGCTAYTKHAPAVVVDSLLTVSDPDDTTLDSATVRVSANLQNGDDLLFADQNGISSSYDDTAGVLTLTGTASIAQYRTALRSVRYRNLASGNPAPTKDVEFTVNDGGTDSAPVTKQICTTGGVGGGNDKPIGQTSEAGLAYTENDGPVPADGGFVVGDADSANLSGATIKFIPVVSQPVDENGDPVGPPVTTNTFAPAEDALAFADQNGISGSYNASTGVLTLSGTASLANYETAIRSVTYENSSENPSDASRRLRFQVTDSSGASSVPSTRDIFVTPVNDAPVVTTTEGSTSYIGTPPAVKIDAGLTVGDVDDTNIEGAQVRIASGFTSGDDLVYVDQLGIAGVYNTGTGVLTLTGTASLADYQTALRSIRYGHTGGNPSGARTVEFTVNDGDLDSAAATKDLQLNDQPVLTTTGTALSYTENAGPVAVDPEITATDADSTTLSGATIQVTSNFVLGEDHLAFAPQLGITGFVDPETGILTLSGTASVADYQTALRSVTYENSSNDPSGATRTVVFRADDGAAGNNLSEPVTRDIEVTPVNDAPVVAVSDGGVSYTEGDPATAVDPGLTVADVDSANLSGATIQITPNLSSGEDVLASVEQPGITSAYNATTGTLTLTGSAPVADYETAIRSVTYENTSNNPSSAPRTVTVQVDDGAAGNNLSAPVTRGIGVTPVNDAPAVTTSDGTTSYTEGDPATAIDSGLTVADADDTNIESAQVQISSGFEAGDELTFTTQNGISGVYNAGLLTLTGTASVADYQTALRSIEFSRTAAGTQTSKTVEFKVNDGGVDSNAAPKSIAITPAQ
jgi:hypothetical protein